MTWVALFISLVLVISSLIWLIIDPKRESWFTFLTTLSFTMWKFAEKKRSLKADLADEYDVVKDRFLATVAVLGMLMFFSFLGIGLFVFIKSLIFGVDWDPSLSSDPFIGP